MSTCNRPQSLCQTNKREKFWLDDFRELYQNNNFTKFFPRRDTTRTEQMNAMTRFFIYFLILLLIFNKSENWLYIPITAIVLLVIFHNIHKFDKDGKRKELFRILEQRREEQIEDEEYRKKEYTQDGDDPVELKEIDYTREDLPPRDTPLSELVDYSVESGYLDSENSLVVGKMLNPPRYNCKKDPSLFTTDEMLEYQKNTCRRPTPSNPFMNNDITEFNNPSPPAACNADDQDIKDEIRVNFNHDLFRDVDELWERKNSQRQFYTTPNTAIPNQQVEFAKWLYNIPDNRVCKTDGCGQNNCLRYEDLRFKR